MTFFSNLSKKFSLVSRNKVEIKVNLKVDSITVSHSIVACMIKVLCFFIGRDLQLLCDRRQQQLRLFGQFYGHDSVKIFQIQICITLEIMKHVLAFTLCYVQSLQNNIENLHILCKHLYWLYHSVQSMHLFVHYLEKLSLALILVWLSYLFANQNQDFFFFWVNREHEISTHLHVSFGELIILTEM